MRSGKGWEFAFLLATISPFLFDYHLLNSFIAYITAKKQMLQYVRRNLKQFREVIELVAVKGQEVRQKIIERLKVAEEIYRQQLYMYKQKVNRIKDRIVSFHRPYV